MELAYLREFLQLAQTLNYSEAARQLYVSQPALTRHMQMPERARCILIVCKPPIPHARIACGIFLFRIALLYSFHVKFL